MFTGALSLLMAVCGTFCFWRYFMLKKAYGETDWAGGGIAFSVATFILFVVFVFGTMVQYAYQKSDFEELRKIRASEVIYKDKAESLTKQFAGYLAEAYPQHERDIFKKISPDKVSFYMVKYPQLQTSQTLTALVAEISKLQGDYYGQQLKAQETLKNIRFRQVNPWFVNAVIPALPPDIRN
ncbi:MAG: hypothetical protein COY09_02535 [Candidatus Portnoybacteria bacterium CG_4_10_14_0_2_um_filter_39_11]|uniref:DUF4239 domain-containing protein n=1 Tax=Candidatus Portnoybacteria bacterium CG_4_10_14_0_2_um_filter_39_11 TaxID=1974797 RepID=A0A2M7UHC7_9BACT|nr:MAG: hypothetical protein COY09_02535 [Candidatus Portnoybacteria bacterium CG_4_10_14_0_2_um_filter_39_11]